MTEAKMTEHPSFPDRPRNWPLRKVHAHAT